MNEFFAMGGYAAYVWPAYALAIIVIGGFAINAVTRYRAAARELDLLQARRPGASR
ncbi:MAG: heme exporter protein CcmD [Aliidongia sp.]|jgi:heme exporter protein D